MRSFALLSIGLIGCSEYEYSELTFDERFDQPDVERKADVLFVVDDSASMVEEQALLQENFRTFVDVLGETYADFQLGVVSTDVDSPEAGLLRGGIVTPDTPDLEGLIAAALDVGTGGSREEQGLAAAALALDGRNPGLHRDGARLNIVVFSDEDDHSDGPVEEWLVAYEQVAGPLQFAVHAVVGDLPAGCASGSSAADAGDRYIAAAVQTEGWRESICADDYTLVLTRVGLDVAGLTDTFPLENVPEPATIVVQVDEVVIPNREADGWVYDPGDNAIVFDGRAVPRPGMAIGVHYELLAGADAASADGG